MSDNVRIVTDSTAVLKKSMIDKYRIEVVPLKVLFGDEVFKEGLDINSGDFYSRISRGEIPTTSHPGENEFIDVYKKSLDYGSSILSIHTPSKLSGTVDAARAARTKFPKEDIKIIDSRTIGLGMLVIPAAEAAVKGKSLKQVEELTQNLNNAIYTVGALNTLEYLKRGGRIGTAKALLGGMLRIKPILSFEEGEVKILVKARTTKRAIRSMIDLVSQNMKSGESIHAVIVYTSDDGPAISLRDEMDRNFKCDNLEVSQIGPVLGTHIGPGFFGLGFYESRYLEGLSK